MRRKKRPSRRFTEAQRMVFWRIVLHGQTGLQIATGLNIDIRTVKNHKRAIFDKSGYGTVNELATAFVSNPENFTEQLEEPEYVERFRPILPKDRKPYLWWKEEGDDDEIPGTSVDGDPYWMPHQNSDSPEDSYAAPAYPPDLGANLGTNW